MIHQIYPQVAHSFQYEINKDMSLAAAHFIPHEAAGKCANLHGHTYMINITVAGDELDETGFLVNFQQLKRLVHDRFDHTLINDHSELFNEKNSYDFPTAESIARKVCDIVQEHLDTLPNRPKCLQVFVRETPTSYAVYRPKWEKK
jgi:6-pyruvoyltetrahydropterin/6-carboxytetrahydropterin synthase